MKQIVIFLLAMLPTLLHAGVIMKKSGERLEDVTIKSVTDAEILYEQEGTEATIEKSEVSAILYDDGRYEEVKHSSSSSVAQNGQNYSSVSMGNGEVAEYNVYAFGNYIKIYYVTDHKHDGAIVEYRVIYKGQNEEPEWNYLGTAPFAYTTAFGGINPMISADAQNIAEPNPLVVENPKKMKKVEFRLSQEGYKTVVTSPLVQIDVTGLYYFVSLNKLKPLKAGETNEEQPKIVKKASNTPEQETISSTNIQVDENTQQGNKASKKQAKEVSNRLIPQICYTEGKKAYDATYKEGQAQAIRKGYSKAQAILIAGEFAEQAKHRAIDECYETIVERDEELSPETSDYANPSVSLFHQYELSASGKAIIPHACTEEGKKAYEAVYSEAEAKAVRQGYSKSQAKTVAAEAGEKAKKKAIDECYDNIVNKGQDYFPLEDNTTPREEKANSPKAKTESIIPQVCLIEGERIYTKALKEAQEIALKQGYSKDQAKTIAPEIAENAKAKAIDNCYNRIVVSGEDFFAETGDHDDLSEDKTVVQGAVSLGLSEKSKQIIPQACYTEGKKAYDSTYEKTYSKALRQGYSKSQAAKIANETAQKAQQTTIEDFYDKIVIKGGYYTTETVQKDEKTSQKAKTAKVTKETKSKDVPQKQVKTKSKGKNKAKAQKAKKSDPKDKSQKTASKNKQTAKNIEKKHFIIAKVNNDKYIYGRDSLDRKNYERFIQENCPEAWKKHLSAKRTIAAGWTFFGVGLVGCTAWSLLPIADYLRYGSSNYTITSDTWNLMYDIGVITGSAGAGLTGLSIPLLAGGYGAKHNTYKTYNKKCVDSPRKSSLALNMQINSNGLGLALRF